MQTNTVAVEEAFFQVAAHWQTLQSELLALQPGLEPVPLSVVIPTLNSAHAIRWTLASLEKQDYPELELVIVDAGSTDGTLDLVSRSYRGQFRIYTVAEYQLAEMYNRGVSLAAHETVGFLLPGDVYLSRQVLWQVAQEVRKHDTPDLVYGGCLLRSPRREPRVLLGPISRRLAQQGRQSTSLQACWFQKRTLRRLGKFNPRYPWRSPFDLLSRLSLRSDVRMVQVKRVFVDHQRRRFGSQIVFRRAWETQQIVASHFGTKARLRWWLGAHPFRFIRMWWRGRARD